MTTLHSREERIRAMLGDILAWDMPHHGRADAAGEWPTRLNDLVAAGDSYGLKELEGELWGFFWETSLQAEREEAAEQQENMSHES